MRFAMIVLKGLVASPPQIIPSLGQGTRWAIPTGCLIALAAGFTALLAAAAVAQPPASDPPAPGGKKPGVEGPRGGSDPD